jgi:hypothetical protein
MPPSPSGSGPFAKPNGVTGPGGHGEESLGDSENANIMGMLASNGIVNQGRK